MNGSESTLIFVHRTVRNVDEQRTEEGQTVVHQRRFEIPNAAERIDGEIAQHRHQFHPLRQTQFENGRSLLRRLLLLIY